LDARRRGEGRRGLAKKRSSQKDDRVKDEADCSPGVERLR